MAGIYCTLLHCKKADLNFWSVLKINIRFTQIIKSKFLKKIIYQDKNDRLD